MRGTRAGSLLRARTPIGVLATLVVMIAGAARGDDARHHRGLLARYQSGGQSVTRLDEELQFDWGDESPDPRLKQGPFTAGWVGRWNVQTDQPVMLHAWFQGEVQILVDGQQVLQQARDQAGWSSAQAWQPGLEDPQLEIRFRKTGHSAALRLFWSSAAFPAEPLTGRFLYHEDPPESVLLERRGRALFDALKCARCHAQPDALEPPPAASLAHAARHIERAWLVEWLSRRSTAPNGRRMPDCGLTADDAHHVAAWLRELSPETAEKLDAPPPPDSNEAARRRGEILFRSVGCLACHARGNLGTDDPARVGTRLDHLNRKRSRDWVFTWLKDPQRLNAARQMPTFDLADDERRDLAWYLGGDAGMPAAQEAAFHPDAARGRQLARQARCANCHDIPGAEGNHLGIPSLSAGAPRWEAGCARGKPDPARGKPAYALSPADEQALRIFVEGLHQWRAPAGSAAQAGRLLARKGCLQCHERGGSSGAAAVAGAVTRTDREFSGMSELLLPPRLDAAGDKLHDQYLLQAVTGNLTSRRLPWLAVRMPRFSLEADERQMLARWFIGQDRVPAGAPAALAAPRPPEDEPQRQQWAQAASVVGGARGFNCVSCHRVGPHEPRNLAPSTRGSNLHRLGERMRPEFFARWVRSALRVAPNTEMPSYERPLPDILDGMWDLQISALWMALNQPVISPPLDTSTVEQILEVAKGAPPRVVRDVFSIGPPRAGGAGASGFVPRALAMGLGNQTNLLFDLDLACVRAAWPGGFARQRASGKSWFWEPNTAQPVNHGPALPGIALRLRDSPRVTEPKSINGRHAALARYQVGSTGIELSYRVAFELPQGLRELLITETFTVRPGEQPGIVRQVSSLPPPAGYDLVLRQVLDGQTQEAPLPGPWHTLVPFNERVVATIFYGTGPAFAPEATAPAAPQAPTMANPQESRRVDVVPGYQGRTLPLPRSIMPTAICLLPDGALAFCSLKGHVWVVASPKSPEGPARLVHVESGLAAPFGVIADGPDLIVAHKPELLRLRDLNGDGAADLREVVADGWGYTDDYHDWTTGIVRDARGRLYVGTGSDYAKAGRTAEQGRYRGKVLRIDAPGRFEAVGHAFRYPTGLAIDSRDRIFVTDNQGVQNPFNEINLLVEGAHYGVPALFEEPHEGSPQPAAILVPHPWTRSVNGIFFLNGPAGHPFAGHGLGCEYDGRFLIRFTLDWVDGVCQGAVYPFSLPPGRTLQGERSAAADGTVATKDGGLLGTLCGAATPDGDLFIGCIHDSGWGGGSNIGEIVHLRPASPLPLGIREIRCTAAGFRLSFTAPVDRQTASRPASYEISGATRVWKGGYATPDTGRHRVEVIQADVAADGLTVNLRTGPRQPGHLYEIRCGRIARASDVPLWPDVGFYTLHRLPRE